MVYFPLIAYRLLLSQSGVTIFDLETRRYPALTIITRWSTVAMAATTTYLNPLLYLTTRKNLRISFLILMPFFGQRRNRVIAVAPASFNT